jgi:hypothetical protein
MNIQELWTKKIQPSVMVLNGTITPPCTLQWAGTDTEECFDKHAWNEKVGNYDKNSITYCINELGVSV